MRLTTSTHRSMARLAFYVTEKLPDHWRVTASADTREGPVKDLFSNFLDKSPDSLFRRIDPDYHFPTFGDDSIVEEVAPTLGKLYVKVSHDESHALWGNFKVGYLRERARARRSRALRRQCALAVRCHHGLRRAARRARCLRRGAGHHREPR